MNLRWFWTTLVLILALAVAGFGLLSRQWRAEPPPSARPGQAGIGGPVSTFQVTIPIPGRLGADSANGAGGQRYSVRISNEYIAPTPPSQPGEAASEPAVADETQVEPAGPAWPLKFDGLLLDPPGPVPPFAPDRGPILTLETESQGRMVKVKGVTNLPIKGNGVQVSLFRLYREERAAKDKRAGYALLNLPLGFENQFPVEDGSWFKAWVERNQAFPEIFPPISAVEQERVFLEVIFTAPAAEVGPVPGLEIFPLPGSSDQVYRIIRPIRLPLDQEARRILARQTAVEPVIDQPSEPPPGEIPPRGPTGVEIEPLRWVDGPQRAAVRPHDWLG